MRKCIEIYFSIKTYSTQCKMIAFSNMRISIPSLSIKIFIPHQFRMHFLSLTLSVLHNRVPSIISFCLFVVIFVDCVIIQYSIQLSIALANANQFHEIIYPNENLMKCLNSIDETIQPKIDEETHQAISTWLNHSSACIQ